MIVTKRKEVLVTQRKYVSVFPESRPQLCIAHDCNTKQAVVTKKGKAQDCNTKRGNSYKESKKLLTQKEAMIATHKGKRNSYEATQNECMKKQYEISA